MARSSGSIDVCRGAAVGLCGLVLLGACTTPAPAVESEAPSAPAGASTATWRTDFGRLADGVQLDEFVLAARGRDAIPAIDSPSFVSPAAVDWIGPREPVIAIEAGGEWRAYPLQILLWHEIVNDSLGGQPIAVTFCPLCHTSVAFDRELAGQLLDFGVTGYLRRSDLVMYDRQTETWWQQATGVGLMGTHAGEHLTILPSSIVAWSEFALTHPEGTVLDRATGFSRPYGQSPYPGWDLVERNPFLGPAQLEPCDDVPNCLDPKERVGVVSVAGETIVYPFREVAAAGGMVHDEIGGRPVVVWWLPEVTTVLGNQLLERADQVGTLVAFDRALDGVVLEFELQDGQLSDPGGSHWNAFGQATDGPAAGAQLVRLQVDTPYWFAFAAFGAGYRIWRPEAVDPG